MSSGVGSFEEEVIGLEYIYFSLQFMQLRNIEEGSMAVVGEEMKMIIEWEWRKKKVCVLEFGFWYDVKKHVLVYVYVFVFV